MMPVERGEILPLEAYERLRPEIRERMLAIKARRRLHVGEHVILLFECRETVWYQIQEMLRVERIFREPAIRHEMDTYNELIAAEGGDLGASLFIQVVDPEERDALLDRLVGLHEHVWMRVGQERFAACFDHRQYDGDRVSAVQFLRFPLAGLLEDRGPEVIEDAASRGLLAVEIDHPHLSLRTDLPLSMATALAADLREPARAIFALSPGFSEER